jgi:hypothetical protein
LLPVVREVRGGVNIALHIPAENADFTYKYPSAHPGNFLVCFGKKKIKRIISSFLHSGAIQYQQNLPQNL